VAALNVPRTRIERIAREEKPVTANTALWLGKFFKTGAALRMHLRGAATINGSGHLSGTENLPAAICTTDFGVPAR
jgi:plasmid maintenance system antidote protein VapI